MDINGEISNIVITWKICTFAPDLKNSDIHAMKADVFSAEMSNE